MRQPEQRSRILIPRSLSIAAAATGAATQLPGLSKLATAKSKILAGLPTIAVRLNKVEIKYQKFR
ncbi:Protein of unknown function [Lactobacillus delbrueckii subsp. bulgaricus]|nr:Protein of unknown function [Lactobacillus delbrueckii subsp. bulgaricus]